MSEQRTYRAAACVLLTASFLTPHTYFRHCVCTTPPNCALLPILQSTDTLLVPAILPRVTLRITCAESRRTSADCRCFTSTVRMALIIVLRHATSTIAKMAQYSEVKILIGSGQDLSCTCTWYRRKSSPALHKAI